MHDLGVSIEEVGTRVASVERRDVLISTLLTDSIALKVDCVSGLNVHTILRVVCGVGERDCIYHYQIHSHK